MALGVEVAGYGFGGSEGFVAFGAVEGAGAVGVGAVLFEGFDGGEEGVAEGAEFGAGVWGGEVAEEGLFVEEVGFAGAAAVGFVYGFDVLGQIVEGWELFGALAAGAGAGV